MVRWLRSQAWGQQGLETREVLAGREPQGPTERKLNARIEELAEERRGLSFWRKALNCFWGEGEGRQVSAPFLEGRESV